ncbi:methyltransferase domain-containing protein [Alteromonas sp. BL110]|uniref:putative RNA methyltransferase n=1 Tax=Alteromonas sp. BL110 TaxID=1714845 RepID=UPI000E47BF2F|nr:methyltransferase domain-containing protein [Alteromonas sp. BL110]AXT40380.1 methyltransferase domain-containing protein [Alteromonas sp. BL110]RKM79612.1 methyltransferase domain-containing protein [Alteromonas sp. BL110]
MWHCPLCKSPISLDSTPVRCEMNHSFDKAKSGYVNLLPVQFKKSKLPGDDKDMVKSRREFHQLNTYQPLKDRLIELVGDLIAESCKEKKLAEDVSKQSISIYDAGCGEGSYLDAMVQGLLLKGFSVKAAGSDISKIAVELAAKAYKHAQFVVASSFELPLEKSTQDLVIQVFAPGSNDEYERVLKSEGLLLTVDPAPNHLFELKQQVYDTPRRHQIDDGPRSGFTRIHDECFSFPINFESEDHKIALIKMTPFYWKLPHGKIESIVASLEKVTADFHIQIWRKGAGTDCEKLDVQL